MGMNVDVFSPEDVPHFREHEAYYPGKDYSDGPNVVAIRKGTGGGKSLIFSSHMDTTVAAPNWQSDPWNPELREGKLYGLGTFDMKGGLAASIMAASCIIELGIQLQGDLYVESVVDEELAERTEHWPAESRVIRYNHWSNHKSRFITSFG
jgi:acetylornithine deacetylase